MSTATLYRSPGADAASEDEALHSPFGPAQFAEASEAPLASLFESAGTGALESPFAEAMALAAEDEGEGPILESLIAELEDEAFDEAIQGLVDEAAAMHLTSSASWSSDSEAPALAAGEVEAWLGGVGTEADRLLERIAEHFGDRNVESLTSAEVESAGERFLAEAGPLSLATEQFLGGLIKKAGKLVKGVVNIAKKGLKAVGKLLPLGKLFAALKRLVQPLLKRVLGMAISRLPVAVRPIAKTLAGKLFGNRESEAPQTGETTATEVAEAFDTRLAESMFASTEGQVDQLVAEAEAEAEAPSNDAVRDLDAARARLSRQLQEATPGVSPVAEVEQFIPIVMAALPIIRLGITIIGRDRVVGFIADKLADLIKGHIGADAAKALSRPIVDIGLKMLTLEAESAEAATGVGAEAVVATLEDTVRRLAELPAEAFSDPLRLESETQAAFAEAAARYIPRSFLARDLAAIETSRDAGVWVYMPRVTRPCFRYRKFTHVYRLAIPRPAARAIRFPSGDTLERRLLDAGARSWPLEAEVHLYETLPGTQLGHLAAFEAGATPAEAAAASEEFEELTPEVAAMLVQEPGLGRSAGTRPGQRRLFRITSPGLRVRRSRRFTVRLDASAAAPVLRLHVRLSERESHEIAGALARKANVQVVSQIRAALGPAFRAALTRRMARHLAEKAGAPVPPARAAELAEKLAEAMLGAVSTNLPSSAPSLGDAARDAAPGVTLTFEFRFKDKAALVSGDPTAPTLVIRPGWHRD